MNTKITDEPDADRFRSYMTFGTGDAFPRGVFANALPHLLALSGTIATEAQREFSEVEHDMTGGSDHLFIIDGLITKIAAEVWAAYRILTTELAALSAMHHARALFETHAVTHWMLTDLEGRWPRILKSSLRERRRFEKAAAVSIGEVRTDIAPLGAELLADDSVRFPPTVHDMIAGHPVLAHDEAVFWKYSSAHVHPGNIGSATIDIDSERQMIVEIIAGCVRHGSRAIASIVDHFSLPLRESADDLADAVTWSQYHWMNDEAPVT